MRQNPCRYCVNSVNYRERHFPSHDAKCVRCEHFKEHKEYLRSQRKFTEGVPITSIDELLQQEWVMWYHQTKHIEVFKNMQLRSVILFLERGAFHKAIRRESEDK